VNAPVFDLGKDGTEAHQFVFDKEGYHLRQSYLFFLAIGEADHGLALYEQLAVGEIVRPTELTEERTCASPRILA
jgi:hypothetical protein